MQPDTYTVETLAEKVGRSEKYVYASLRLTHLVEGVQEEFYAGKLTVAHAFEIARLQPNDQRRVTQASEARRVVLKWACEPWKRYEGPELPGDRQRDQPLYSRNSPEYDCGATVRANPETVLPSSEQSWPTFTN